MEELEGVQEEVVAPLFGSILGEPGEAWVCSRRKICKIKTMSVSIEIN